MNGGGLRRRTHLDLANPSSKNGTAKTQKPESFFRTRTRLEKHTTMYPGILTLTFDSYGAVR